MSLARSFVIFGASFYCVLYPSLAILGIVGQGAFNMNVIIQEYT